MSTETTELTGPDFGLGVPVAQLADGAMVAGHAGGEPVLVVRRGEEFFAVGAHCTHYGAPLADGLLVGDTVRCPWHHACFDLRTGAAVRAPALQPLSRWTTSLRDGSVYVSGRIPEGDGARARGNGSARNGAPSSVIIVGAGAAGDAAAD
ncbi:MAG: Rieske 2Fe-2S domain-containing protein, partial [Gemmatimonadaceae bacterium]|nr:Rieske 2Fe-2S domain-containing protein [Gemmatimonadaceae bacterium]